MTKNLKHGLIAALGFCWASSLPSSCYAQPQQPTIQGTYDGVAVYQEIEFPASGGAFVISSGSGPAIFNFEYTIPPVGDQSPLILTISPGEEIGYDQPFSMGGMTYNSTSASGSVSFSGFNGNAGYGFFSATFDSIMPNGEIVVGSGSASAEIMLDSLMNGIPVQDVVQFSSVPEPSSFAMFAIALVCGLGMIAYGWLQTNARIGTADRSSCDTYRSELPESPA